MTDTEFNTISVRQLVECLKDYIDEAPVHFTPVDKLDATNYVVCRFMGNEETNALLYGKHDPGEQYDNSDVGIHLPDVTVNQFFALEKRRNYVAQDLILRDLMSNRKMFRIERNLWFALFCILHEIGHWKHFTQSGLSAREYEKSEHTIREEYDKLGKRLYKMPDFFPQKIILAEQYHKGSHAQIPSEQSADEYALQNFDAALKLVREAMGYDEEWLSVHWQV